MKRELEVRSVLTNFHVINYFLFTICKYYYAYIKNTMYSCNGKFTVARLICCTKVGLHVKIRHTLPTVEDEST